MIPQLNNCKARTNCLKQLQALTLIVLVGILAILPPSLAFLPNHNIIITNNRYNHIHRDVLAKQPLFLSDRRQAFEHNSLRTDIRIFLTQRAIQSFITLLISCRDPHTVKWLENTYGFENLENYHGTGAFNLTKYNSWNTILKDMLHRPADVVVVSARRRGRGHGGWSKDNPFLEDRFVEFNIDIEPPSIVSRIISVRDQIAKEWVVDLDTLVLANDMILQSYHETIKSARDEECRDLENEDCNVEDLLERKAYERNAMVLLSNKIDFQDLASSPNRKGNFDLLLLLATQEAVHRVLREYREKGEQREVSFEWLRDFYTERVPSFFDGDQKHGRADDFMEELLLSSPSMKELDGKVGLIDPLRIAEDIIAMRSEVARDWKEIVAKAPQDHMELQKVLLAVRMGTNKNLETVRVAETEGSDVSMGSFE